MRSNTDMAALHPLPASLHVPKQWDPCQQTPVPSFFVCTLRDISHLPICKGKRGFGLLKAVTVSLKVDKGDK